MSDFLKKYTALRSVAPFDTLSANDVAVIAESTFFYNFPPKSTIASTGDLPSYLFVVIEGEVIGNGVSKTIFPVRNIMDNSEYVSEFTTQNGAKCLAMSRGHFLSAVRNCPSLLVELFKLESEIRLGEKK